MRATCTWGEGPDVLLVLDGSDLMLYEPPSKFNIGLHGYASQGSAGLTAAEARSLAAQLLAAADQADEIEASLAADELRW